MHKNRSELVKEFPITRKGTKYVSVASHFQNKKMPLIFVLRDILKIAKNRHEAKKILLDKKVKVNGRLRKDIHFPVGLRDFVEIGDKKYKVVLENEKYKLEESKEENKRILKVIGKKIIKKGKTQANLEDGTNILVEENFLVGDSFLVSIPENKLIKIIPLKEGSKVEIIKGKHSGRKGKVFSIEDMGEKKMFKIKLNEGGECILSKEALLAIE
ncbi:MAG: S4 domain-containing protein [Candidatus Pacearchaeota archaeon]